MRMHHLSWSIEHRKDDRMSVHCFRTTPVPPDRCNMSCSIGYESLAPLSMIACSTSHSDLSVVRSSHHTMCRCLLSKVQCFDQSCRECLRLGSIDRMELVLCACDCILSIDSHTRYHTCDLRKAPILRFECRARN